MKTSKLTETQIVFTLKQAEPGTLVRQVIRKVGIAEQTFYRWKKTYGEMGINELRKLSSVSSSINKVR